MTKAYLTVLYSQQLDANRSFYETLGVTFEQHQHPDGTNYLSGKLGDMVFELYPVGENQPISQLRLGLMADPDVTFSEDERQLLVSIADSVHPFENGQTFLELTDPEGRQVEFLF